MRSYWPGCRWQRASFLSAPTADADTIRFGAHSAADRPRRRDRHAEMRGIQFAVDQANAKGGVARQPDRGAVRGQPGQAGPVYPVVQQADRSAACAGDLHRLFRPDAGNGAAGDAQEGAAGQCRRPGGQAGERVALSGQHAAHDRRRDRGACPNSWSARARRRPRSCSRTTPPASAGRDDYLKFFPRPAARSWRRSRRSSARPTTVPRC